VPLQVIKLVCKFGVDDDCNVNAAADAYKPDHLKKATEFSYSSD